MASRETAWLLPLPVGEARHLGDTDVTGARLFPDGRVLYSTDSGLFAAENDGSGPRKLEAILQHASFPAISPDGNQLAFQVDDPKASHWTIHESASDGTGIHQVLKWQQGLPSVICCLRWTADGKYLLFRGKTEGRWDLWAFSSQKRFFGAIPAPVRLTNGPISYGSFAGSRDGKRIFAVGALRRGELVRYDSTSREFRPYLGGISAIDPTFSRDGRWMAYQSYPEHTVWRSRTDGSDRLQLTYAPLTAVFARISPDASKVAFNDFEGNTYVTDINGGTARKVSSSGVAPDWSPDGNLLAVTSFAGSSTVCRLVDVRDGSISDIPNSNHVAGPWFATQDTLVGATDDQSKLVMFDFKTRKWSDFITSPDKFVNWEVSYDGKYVVYSTGGTNQTVFRMRLADRAVKEVVKLKTIRLVDDPMAGPTLSIAPDDSILTSRDIGTEEIYALTVKWP